MEGIGRTFHNTEAPTAMSHRPLWLSFWLWGRCGFTGESVVVILGTTSARTRVQHVQQDVSRSVAALTLYAQEGVTSDVKSESNYLRTTVDTEFRSMKASLLELIGNVKTLYADNSRMRSLLDGCTPNAKRKRISNTRGKMQHFVMTQPSIIARTLS